MVAERPAARSSIARPVRAARTVIAEPGSADVSIQTAIYDICPAIQAVATRLRDAALRFTPQDDAGPFTSLNAEHGRAMTAALKSRKAAGERRPFPEFSPDTRNLVPLSPADRRQLCYFAIRLRLGGPSVSSRNLHD